MPGVRRSTTENARWRTRAFWTVVLTVFALVAAIIMLDRSSPQPRSNVVLGVTYSPRYASSLGFEPRGLFTRALQDLAIDYVRLPLYWDELEPNPGVYDLSDADFYVAAARTSGALVIPILGYKQARWPECFAPEWASELTTDAKRSAILHAIQTEVEHFRGAPNIAAWQVENEPFFNWGECGNSEILNEEFVAREVALVRQLDSRPVLVTDSGEFSSWTAAMRVGDCFGSTLYRSIAFPFVGSIPYAIPPRFYAIKASVLRGVLHTSRSTIVAELQAEPWFMHGGSLADVPISRQLESFPVTSLSDNVAFARDTGFGGVYLWGVEWWYWMAEHGHPEYLGAARNVFGTGGGSATQAGALDPTAGCGPRLP